MRIAYFSAEEFMDVVENYMVNDFVQHSPPEEAKNRRDSIRAEILRYNEQVPGSIDEQFDQVSNGSYIEPTSDGYPGLDAPLG